MRKMKVAIIGGGGIANSHVGGYKNNSNAAELVAVCDVNEEAAKAFAAKHGIPDVYSDVQKLLAQPEIEAVSICTPNFLHAPLSIQALEAGKNVLCEKPMATTVTDAQKMKATADSTGKVLYIGFNHRFIGKFHLAKTLLDGGEFGRLLVARVAIGHNMYARLDSTWFAQKDRSGGGTFIDNGVHMIDMLRWYGGSITSVSGQAHGLKLKQGDVEDNAIGLFTLGNGGMASLQCSWTWPGGYSLLFHMICENGTIDLSTNDVIVQRTGSEESETLTPPPMDAWSEEVKHFLAASRGEEAPFVRPDDGIEAVKVAVACYESSSTGRTVQLASL